MSQHVTVQQTPYAQMPEGVLYDSSLSDKAVRVYGALLRHGSDPTNCYPSHDRIARLIGCSKRSVSRPLDELEKAGWVEREKRYDANGARTSDGYMVRVSRTTDAQESATTTQENVDPPRSGAGTHHAQERDERESVEREPVKERAQRAPRSSLRPTDWTPNEAHQAKALSTGVDLDHEADQFRSHHDAKGSRFVSWDAAFHTWLGNAQKWSVSPIRPTLPGGSRDEWAFG